MSKEKRRRKRTPDEIIEDLYRNKNFVPPKEKNLETIFEEPKTSKDGAPLLTSVRKFRRFIDFEETKVKLRKRKLKAKKSLPNKTPGSSKNKMKTAKSLDVSEYLSSALGEEDESDNSKLETKHENLVSYPTHTDTMSKNDVGHLDDTSLDKNTEQAVCSLNDTDSFVDKASDSFDNLIEESEKSCKNFIPETQQAFKGSIRRKSILRKATKLYKTFEKPFDEDILDDCETSPESVKTSVLKHLVDSEGDCASSKGTVKKSCSAKNSMTFLKTSEGALDSVRKVSDETCIVINNDEFDESVIATESQSKCKRKSFRKSMVLYKTPEK